MNQAREKHFRKIRSQKKDKWQKLVYLSREGFEKEATAICVRLILFNIFNNDLEEAGGKTLMKFIDTAKS